jgi:hypothetical protein
MIFFHIMGVLVMIFGTIVFVGTMILDLGERGVLRGGGDFGWVRFLADISAGLLIFTLGAILFVLAEIAVRVSRPKYISRARGYDD